MIDAVHAPLNPRRWWILANVSIGTFMATLDGSIANVALPTISGSLHISLQSVQWVVTTYLLTISSLLPLVGKISDAIGKGRVYNVGFIVFSIGSLLCSLSPTITWLILSRIAQVFGAALLMANSQLSGWLSDHIGSVVLATGGLIINALGFISLSLLGSHVGFWLIALHLAVFGLGQGMFQSPNNSSIMASVPRTKIAKTSPLRWRRNEGTNLLTAPASNAVPHLRS